MGGAGLTRELMHPRRFLSVLDFVLDQYDSLKAFPCSEFVSSILDRVLELHHFRSPILFCSLLLSPSTSPFLHVSFLQTFASCSLVPRSRV